MDALLDLWISAIYKDQQVRGSQDRASCVLQERHRESDSSITPNCPRAGESPVPAWAGCLKKLAELDHLSLLTFPGRSGTVIYLKELSLHHVPNFGCHDRQGGGRYVSEPSSYPCRIPLRQRPAQFPDKSRISAFQRELSSVSKPHMLYFVRKVLQALESAGHSLPFMPQIQIYVISIIRRLHGQE